MTAERRAKEPHAGGIFRVRAGVQGRHAPPRQTGKKGQADSEED